MILTIDIGNTTTNCGLFERDYLASQWSIPTRLTRTPQQLVRRLKGPRLRKISQIVICSVVPRMVPKISRALRAQTEAPIRIVGRTLKVPLRNRYRDPKQVGQDRLVGAYAAWRSGPPPRRMLPISLSSSTSSGRATPQPAPCPETGLESPILFPTYYIILCATVCLQR